jgi:hypothetical protein
MTAKPRFATPRSPERETLGPQVAAVADTLGQSLLPWQRQVADVALELLPETKIPAYREVDVLVPRQSGKTTLMLCVEVHRSLRWPGGPQRTIYSAQSGQDSRRKLLDDQVPLLRSSPLWVAVDKVARAGGREAILWRSGSRIDVLASNLAAGHGRVVDMGVLDEAFDDVDDRREAAVTPAMATRPGAQLWVISTAGSDASAYLRRKVEAGRAAAEAGETEGVAYFEWSAPDEADIDDPAVWRSCMPALGLTIDEAAVRHARATMLEGEFRRAFLNQWTTAEEAVLPAAVWNAVVHDDVIVDLGAKPVLAIDADPGRGSGSIAIADSHGNLELVEYRNGGSTAWIPDRVAELARQHRAPVVLDGTGPTQALVADLEAAHVRRISSYGRSEMATACGMFYVAVADERVAVAPHKALDDAVAGARKRHVGDQWVWARRETGSDVSPLIAATLAFHKATNQPKASRVVNMNDYAYRDPYGPGGALGFPAPGRLS